MERPHRFAHHLRLERRSVSGHSKAWPRSDLRMLTSRPLLVRIVVVRGTGKGRFNYIYDPTPAAIPRVEADENQGSYVGTLARMPASIQRPLSGAPIR
jgi:hypothetical protein